MKKIALIFTSVIMITGMFTMTSCNKTNTTIPTVTLNGDATISSPLNAAFTDPGATAKDSKDSPLTVSVTVTPAFNKDLAGAYVYRYTATDADGNVGEATRTVNVVNDIIALQGTYNATDDYNADNIIDTTWVETIIASSTVNNQIVFSRFAFYTGCSLKANINSSGVITYPGSQTYMCGAPGQQENRTFTISGTLTGTTITINYHEVDQTSGFTTDGKDVFMKI
jgi:hypothetical protein